MKDHITIKQTFRSPSPDERRKAVTAIMEKLIDREIRKNG